MEVITARQAFEAGKTRYFTGKPCKNAHLCERMIRNGACVECLRAGRNRYARRHPENRARIIAKHRETHADIIRERSRLAKRRMRSVNPEAEKRRQQRFYARREMKLATIAGRPRPNTCDICHESSRQICFDHCHASGAFRGWLCDRCNKVLGMIKDSPELLMDLRDYLKGARVQTNSSEAQQIA